MVPCYKIPQLDQDWLLGTGDHVLCAVFHWALVAFPAGDPFSSPQISQTNPNENSTPCFGGLQLLFTDVSAGIGGMQSQCNFYMADFDGTCLVTASYPGA